MTKSRNNTVCRVALRGTVKHPEGVKCDYPRQYFDVGRQLSQQEVEDLEALLPLACKHISGVFACMRMPSSEQSAHLYVTYGGLSPEAISTDGRIAKHQEDVRRTIEKYLND